MNNATDGVQLCSLIIKLYLYYLLTYLLISLLDIFYQLHTCALLTNIARVADYRHAVMSLTV